MKYKVDKFVNKSEKIMSMDEFDYRVQAGEKLVLLDDMVIDVTKFAYSHPGGQFLIDMNIGKDIGKFFYGGYSFDKAPVIPGLKSNAHTHSNIARKIVNQHIIASI